MKKHTLKAEKRSVVGRKVKQLRAGGQVPATVYGKKVSSTSVSVQASDFAKVYGEAGETGLVELSVAGDVRPVLIHSVQKHPVHGNILHVEFFQVDLKEKVRAKVPIEFIGESPAVVNKQGVLLTLLTELEVEAFPTDLPEKFFLDVSTLAAVNQEFKVADAKVPSGVTLVTDVSLPVVKVGALVSKEAEEQAAVEAAAAAAATPAEGEVAPAGGEAPAEGAKNEGKAEEAKKEEQEQKQG